MAAKKKTDYAIVSFQHPGAVYRDLQQLQRRSSGEVEERGRKRGRHFFVYPITDAGRHLRYLVTFYSRLMPLKVARLAFKRTTVL